MARQNEGPWFRSSKDAWYLWQDGKQVSLGVKGKGNREAAFKAWHRLMSNGTAKPEAKPKTTAEEFITTTCHKTIAKPEAAVTVKELVDAYLSDVKSRAKRTTHDAYAYFIGKTLAGFGNIDATRQ